MKPWGIVLAGLLLAAPMTGCLGTGDSSDTSEGLETKSRAEVTEKTGGIEGLVTDSAVQPIEGATVEVEELGKTTETADDGSFAFSNLQPGAYTLTLTKDGFIGTEKAVSVASGAIETIEVVLAHRPSVQPYMQQFSFKGFMECSVGLAAGVVIGSSNVCQEGPLSGATNTKTTFFHEIQPNAWQIVTEVTWDANTPLGDRFWLAEEPQGFNSAWKVAYANQVGTNPIISHTTRAELTGIVQNFTAICEGEEEPEATSNHFNNPDQYCNHNPIEQGGQVDITVLTQSGDTTTVPTPDAANRSLFPVGAGAAVQQEIQVFQTVFYNTPACEEYSVVEDNRCEQMDEAPSADPYAAISGGNQTASGNQTSGNQTR